MTEMSSGGTYVNLSDENLRTYYETPDGRLVETVVLGVDPTLHVPLAVSVGTGGPEHMDASRLRGLRRGGRMVLADRVGGRAVLLAVLEIADAVRAVAAAARRPAVTTATSSSSMEDAETEEPRTNRWEDSDDEGPAPVPVQRQTERTAPAAQRQQVPDGPTAEEIAARMAQGRRFTTPRGRACRFSDQGDSAVRHFLEYQRSRKEQTAVFFSNVRRYTPLEYLETLLAACDAAIDLYTARTVAYGKNCRVQDAGGREWTIGMVLDGTEHRLTHAHFENYQNS
ncbi:hypothetical protein [Streptomyces lavendulae]|uniref:hypothetical protein n=2 Tax=Streptomyces TaxID=1883 RepID=UPI0036B58223